MILEMTAGLWSISHGALVQANQPKLLRRHDSLGKMSLLNSVLQS